MYLSYSGYKKLATCGLAYFLEYVEHLEVEGVDDRQGALYGIVVGRIFERFYVEKAWKNPQPKAHVMGWVDPVLAAVIKEETSPKKFRPAATILWKGMPGAKPTAYASPEEVAADLRDGVDRGFRIIRHERLLGPRADAEVKLDALIEGHKLAGRADFIIRRTSPHNDLVITDGKGSAYRDAFVDKHQLLWYSMLFREHEKTLPDRVGFIYWRFEPPESSDWFEVTSAEVDNLLEEVLNLVVSVEKKLKTLGSGKKPLAVVREVFPPNLTEAGCKFCPYATEAHCPEGFSLNQEALKKKSKKTKEKV